MIDTVQYIDVKPQTDSKSGHPVILLLLQNTQDRKLFIKDLPDNFTVITDEKSLATDSFDLCIIDVRSSHLYRESLESIKEQAFPIFVPILLLCKEPDVLKKYPVVSKFTDDVVYVPTSAELLRSRIHALLRQRRYSHELFEEKRKYKLITENTTDMISLHTPDGTYLYVSPASKEITGYSPEELVGKNAYELMHPSDREAIEKVENPFADKDVIRYSFRKKVKGGNYKWVETHTRPILDDQTGEIIKLQSSTRDISISKDLEKKLTEEKEYIDKAIQSLPELLFMIDEDLNYVKWTNVEKTLGYIDQEVRQMHPLDFFREEDHDLVISKIQEVFATGRTEFDSVLKAKSGKLTPYHIKANRLTRGDKKFLVGTCINLAEIRATEYNLEQQQLLFDAIVNQTESIIYVQDKNRRYKLVNESYLNFFGLAKEDVIGKTDLEIHSQELDSEVKKSEIAVLEEGKTVKIEERIPVGDSYEYYYSIKYLLKDVPGYEDCLCGVSTNITDLKLASNQLEKRINEQQCLYNISKLSEQATTIEKLLEKAVSSLSSDFKHPEITEVAIRFGDKVYKTDGYHESETKLSSESKPIADTTLRIDIVYLEEKKKVFDQNAYSNADENLIDSINEILSSQAERIYTRSKLKESEIRWSNLVKNDPNLIQILEPDGTIQFINEAGATMLGYESPNEIIGQNYFDIVELEDVDVELSNKRVQHVLGGGDADARTHRIRVLNGKILYLESEGVPTTLDDGRTGVQHVAKDVTERVKYEKKLEESLSEKETLLQEIHHRVKNNLAVVSGMMELQTYITENEEAKSVLADSRNRIQTMAIIHEKLYESKSLSEIEFGPYVEELVEYIGDVNSVSEDIELEFDCDAFNLNINQAVPCALIINEIVSNAYKHAFSDQKEGKIFVSLKHNEDTITVKIRDNGRGMPDNQMDQKKETMGFIIIDTLIKQLQAEMNVESNGGLEYSFWFEKKNSKGSSSSLTG